MSTEQSPTLSEQPAERQNQALWDTEDVAAYLKVSRSTVRRKVESGEIPFTRVGNLIRFIPADIEQWVRQQAA